VPRAPTPASTPARRSPSFTSLAEIDPAHVLAALREDLPSTIRAIALREAWSAFHAHWSSCGKVYRYRISYEGESHSWRLPRAPEVNIARLEVALGWLRAAEDISALCVRRDDDPEIRRLERLQILESTERGLTLEVAAAGFGKYLVRHLVAAAVGYAIGAYDDTALAKVISGEVKRPPRADAEGLTLHRVLYPEPLDPFPDLDHLCPERA
jgi:tRNA pseudouridine38-40 synthase